MTMLNDTKFIKKSGTITNVDLNDETEISLGSKVERFRLHAIVFRHTGGTATNYLLRLSNDTGWTDGDYTEIYTGTSTAVGTATNEYLAVPRIFETDSTGSIYLRTGSDAGADNDGAYSIWFEVLE